MTIKEMKKKSINQYGVILPIDAHKAYMSNSIILVPTLMGLESEYEILIQNGVTIHPWVRNDGLASLLRLHGKGVINEIDNTCRMSILPTNLSYFTDNKFNRDKYYSGIQAFRNACSHINKSDLEVIFVSLNCGPILKRLLHEDPLNWKSSMDFKIQINDSFGEGWSLAHTLHISKDLNDPVLIGVTGFKLDAKEAENLIFNE